MLPRNSLLIGLGGIAFVLASCAPNLDDPRLVKTHPEYKNPHQPGTYEFFVGEKDYPKTYDVWTNSELLAETKPSNSWLQIDLETQRGKLMNGDQVVIDYPICSGRKSHPTPPGTYKILEKVVDKSSNKYGKMYDAEGKVVNSDANAFEDAIPEGGKFEGAPMKYWMRLTNDGVGHHIGPVKRVPVSHACIRGPSKTMPIIYSKLAVGSKIVVE
jgi:L,D-transpeptidase catalytic domain